MTGELQRLKWLCANSKPGEVDSTIELGIQARTQVPALLARVAALEAGHAKLKAALGQAVLMSVANGKSVRVPVDLWGELVRQIADLDATR